MNQDKKKPIEKFFSDNTFNIVIPLVVGVDILSGLTKVYSGEYWEGVTDIAHGCIIGFLWKEANNARKNSPNP